MPAEHLDYDAFIVGQGLAGSVLARTLVQRGWKVLVLDRYQKNSASRVAAGMWNPIVFKRLNKSWRSEEALPEAASFFQDWEEQLGMKAWHPTPIVRLFPDQSSANDFLAKSTLPGFENILQTNSCADGEDLRPPHGYGRVEGSGYLLLGKLLDEVRTRWKETGMLQEAEVSESDFTLSETVEYAGKKAAHLILCQGHELLNGELFGWLPLRRTKGEVLDVTIPGYHRKHIINNGRWAIPLAEPGLVRLGATYEWHTADPSITEEAKALLMQRLEPVIGKEMKVIDQRGGIRPTVKDRRPLLGTHPDHPQVHVFNGLGTRGVMIAPMLAREMADWLESKGELRSDVSIQRFEKK